ncbi:MAG: hypothetical protein IJ067_10755 [Prevotella sp.]|nr:hypothetical protein [Prevotella sp.]
MKITIINGERTEKTYARVELADFIEQLKDGSFRQPNTTRDMRKEVCFAAGLQKHNGELIARNDNHLVLLSLENLRDLPTVREYKELANRQLYTMLCFIGADGHSLQIVCRYTGLLLNAFRKLHYIYSSQLGTQVADREPTLTTSCKVSYDPQPYYNPEALAITVSDEPEDVPEYRAIQEDISDFNYPEEIPGMSVHDSRMRRFHDCLDAATEAHLGEEDEQMFAVAVLEQLADGCRQMGLPQAWCARVATFYPRISEVVSRDTIESVFRSAYLKEMLKTIPLKFTRPSALLAYKTEAYMKEHYTLRLNVMTGVPEYRQNALGYGFQPLNQAARNTMAINALKAGVDSWDKDLARYIDSNLNPRYEPMADFMRHLPQWKGKHDYVGELARRVKTSNPYWEEDFHKWMLSMVAQWLGKDRQHGNAIVPLLIGPQGSGKTTFCSRLLPGYLQTYFNDRLSMKNDNDIFIAMSSYALINIDEFDAMSKSQQPILKYLISKHDVKFRPPYGKMMEERQRFASFIATTNNLRPLTDPTGSRRFICVYADEIDNSGIINYNQLYAQLRAELEQGRRYWFEDEDNQRIIEQNRDFQQVCDYGRMIELTYLPPAETGSDTGFIFLQDILKRLARSFPTFTMGNNTDREVGRKLVLMGYERKHQTKGVSYRMKER